MNKIKDNYSNQFITNGYVRIPSVIKPELIKTIRNTFTIPIANHVLSKVPNRRKISADKVITSEVPELYEMLVENLKDVLLPSIKNDSVYLMYDLLFLVPKGSPYHTIVHWDIGAQKETMEDRFPRYSWRHPNSISVWIPLVDVDINSSCMYVVPFGTNIPKYLPMKAGDVLFISYFIPHGSTVNSGDYHRETMLMSISPVKSNDESDMDVPLIENGKVVKTNRNKIKKLIEACATHAKGEDDYRNV